MKQSSNSIFGIRRTDSNHLIKQASKRPEWWLNIGYAEEIEMRELDRYVKKQQKQPDKQD